VGAPITGANIVIRNGVIEDVGPSVAIPADALVVDGTNMNVYPGLIDMQSSAPLEAAAQNTNTFATLEEAERAKREIILRPDYMAAENLVASNTELTQLASAGVTTVLAVPPNGIFKGQSALVNVAVPADDP